MAVRARGEKCKSSFRAVDFKDDGEQVRQLEGEASGGRSSEKQGCCWEG